jgi:hypothetical protein
MRDEEEAENRLQNGRGEMNEPLLPHRCQEGSQELDDAAGQQQGAEHQK